MRRSIKLSLLICFLCSINIQAQETEAKPQSIDELKKTVSKFKNGRRFKVKYDKFDDRTYVFFSPGFYVSTFGMFMSGNRTVELGIALTFKGEGIKDSNSFLRSGIIFTAKGKDWTFLKDNHLQAIADEQRFDFGLPDSEDSEVVRGLFGEVRTIENYAFEISLEELKFLADSNKAEMRIGKFEFKLKDEHKQMFKDMLSLKK